MQILEIEEGAGPNRIAQIVAVLGFLDHECRPVFLPGFRNGLAGRIRLLTFDIGADLVDPLRHRLLAPDRGDHVAQPAQGFTAATNLSPEGQQNNDQGNEKKNGDDAGRPILAQDFCRIEDQTTRELAGKFQELHLYTPDAMSR